MRARNSKRAAVAAPKRKNGKATRTSSEKRKGARRRRKKRSFERPRGGRVLLGLGSNLGNRLRHIRSAMEQIARIAPIRRVSSLYLSDPVGHSDQPDFYNLVAEISWHGSPEELLAAVQGIERRVGRKPTFRFGPREIDIDILDFAGLVRDAPGLSLPHPRMATRRFVLEPLAEIAPRWRHPESGRRPQELLENLPARPGARRLSVTSSRARGFASRRPAREAPRRGDRERAESPGPPPPGVPLPPSRKPNRGRGPRPGNAG